MLKDLFVCCSFDNINLDSMLMKIPDPFQLPQDSNSQLSQPHCGLDEVVNRTGLVSTGAVTGVGSAWPGPLQEHILKPVTVRDKHLTQHSPYLTYLLYFLLKINENNCCILIQWGANEQTDAHIPPALTPTHWLSIPCVRAEADVRNIEQLCHNGQRILNWMLHSPTIQADDFLLTDRPDYCN